MGMPMYMPNPSAQELKVIPRKPQQYAGFYGGLAAGPNRK